MFDHPGPCLDVACQLSKQIRHKSDLILRPYQIEALGRCLFINTLVDLAPGLGKTAITCAAIRMMGTVALIIPRVARAVWLKDLYRFGGVTSFFELRGKQRLKASYCTLNSFGISSELEVSDRLPPQPGVYLLTHESVGSWADTLPAPGAVKMIINSFDAPPLELPDHFDLTIIDESHRLGDQQAKRSWGSSRFAELSDRVVLLSGTPDMGGVHRLWSQFKLLNRFLLPDYYTFIKYYCSAVETQYGLQPMAGAHLDELSQIIEPHVLTYSQKDVLPFLPKNTRDRITVPLTGEMARKLGSKVEAARKALHKLGDVGADRTSWFLPGEVTEARLACAEAKVPVVAEEALQLSASGERVVVWAWHRSACNMVAGICRSRGAKVFLITGVITNASVVDSTIEEWAQTPNGILIATIAKLGEGEDRLVASCWQLFLEVDWLPQTVSQAEHRLLRLSQTRPVNTRFFELELPFERSLVDRILTRAEDTDSLFGGESSIDIGELFGLKRIGNTEEILRRMSERLG